MSLFYLTALVKWVEEKRIMTSEVQGNYAKLFIGIAGLYVVYNPELELFEDSLGLTLVFLFTSVSVHPYSRWRTAIWWMPKLFKQGKALLDLTLMSLHWGRALKLHYTPATNSLSRQGGAKQWGVTKFGVESGDTRWARTNSCWRSGRIPRIGDCRIRELSYQRPLLNWWILHSRRSEFFWKRMATKKWATVVYESLDYILRTWFHNEQRSIR